MGARETAIVDAVRRHVFRSDLPDGVARRLVLILEMVADGRAMPSQEQLAADLNITERTLRRDLAAMGSRGFVFCYQNGRGGAEYFANWDRLATWAAANPDTNVPLSEATNPDTNDRLSPEGPRPDTNVRLSGEEPGHKCPSSAEIAGFPRAHAAGKITTTPPPPSSAPQTRPEPGDATAMFPRMLDIARDVVFVASKARRGWIWRWAADPRMTLELWEYALNAADEQSEEKPRRSLVDTIIERQMAGRDPIPIELERRRRPWTAGAEGGGGA